MANIVEQKIWNFLYNCIKNEYGVAGLMGNLYAESGLKSTNLQNSFNISLKKSDELYTSEVDNNTYKDFISDKAGYGIAQWTYSTRKKELLSFAQKNKTSIGDLNMQLQFLIQELQYNFPKVLDVLQKANNLKDATNIVLTQFEKPANMNTEVQNTRLEYSTKYYNMFRSKIDNSANNVVNNNSIEITPYYGITNTNYLANRKIEYIVIHYTGGSTSKKGSAMNLASACRNGNLQSSAEFYVDDGSIVQYIQDIQNRYSWSVGGNKYPAMSTSLGGLYYGKCTNKNSINIEICNEKVNKKSFLATDTDWYFTEAAISNAVKLTQYLMKQYNIDINHVIMHHSTTGKQCPIMWTQNEKNLSGWYDFLTRVNNGDVKINIKENNNSTSTISSGQYLVRVTAERLNVRVEPDVNSKIVTTIKKNDVYTIIEEKNNWGKLKSGIGWISLKYTNKI